MFKGLSGPHEVGVGKSSHSGLRANPQTESFSIDRSVRIAGRRFARLNPREMREELPGPADDGETAGRMQDLDGMPGLSAWTLTRPGRGRPGSMKRKAKNSEWNKGLESNHNVDVEPRINIAVRRCKQGRPVTGPASLCRIIE